MSPLSSQDLHPQKGARFVLEREHEGAYSVQVFLPAGVRVDTRLQWDAGGQPVLSPEPAEQAVREHVLKLARVLRKTPKARLTRWRELE